MRCFRAHARRDEPGTARADAGQADALAARLLDEATAHESAHETMKAQAALEQALVLGVSRPLRARALRALAEHHYREGNSKRALDYYQRLRPRGTK